MAKIQSADRTEEAGQWRANDRRFDTFYVGKQDSRMAVTHQTHTKMIPVYHCVATQRHGSPDAFKKFLTGIWSNKSLLQTLIILGLQY